MKKFALSAFVIVIFGFYLLSTVSRSSTYVAAVPPQTTKGSAAAPTPLVAASGSGAGRGMMGNGQMGPGMMGAYRNGSYTGSAADAYYGTVQVQATIQGGRLSNVEFLQYPNDRGTSIYINGIAMPQLIQEAITAQSAQVDGVSGATATSQAFAQSLASALAQAKN